MKQWFLGILALVGVGSLLIVASDGLLLHAEDLRQEKNSASASPFRFVAHRGERPDPVEANGPIFVDWPVPNALLMFTGAQDGYLEPCGCAGLDNQKGGLKRRHTLMKELRAKGWPLAAMDVGGQVRRFGPQAEIKFRHGIEALVQMGYQAIGFGEQDLRMEVLPVLLNLEPDSNPMVSANVAVLDFESGFTSPYRILQVGDLKIGVTSVMGERELASLKNIQDVQLLQPNQAIPRILPKLLAEKCDHLVLLAYAERSEAIRLGKRFPEFTWIVSALGADEPPSTPDQIEGTGSYLLEVGHKGMYAVAIGLYGDRTAAFRYQRVPIDHRFEDSPEIQNRFIEYQEELKTLGLEGLGLKPIPHPSGEQFAGSGACIDCHASAHEVFEQTPHAHATQTLVELDPPRHHDPECLSCHVVGWNPQKYYPYESGFLGLDVTPELNANGCENCHGPGARHAAAENGEIDVTDAEMEALQKSMRMKIVENEGNMPNQVFTTGSVVDNCMQCHDLDNSPDFDFQEYWPDVEHEGKD